MALKKKISKVEFDALKPEVQALYVPDGDKGDAYKVDLDGDDDPVELKRAKDREKARADDAEKKLKEIEDKRKEDEEAIARGKGDLKTIEDSWKSKLSDQKNRSDGEIAKYRAVISKQFVSDVARNMAKDVSNAPDLLLPHIQSRLTVEYDGEGMPTTRVLDAEGKISASTVADLQAEMIANPKFKSIILATKASGGAGLPSLRQPGGGAPIKAPVIPGTETVNLAKLSPKQMVEHIKANPTQQEGT